MLFGRYSALAIIVALALGEITFTFLYIRLYHLIPPYVTPRLLSLALLMCLILGTPYAQMFVAKAAALRDKHDGLFLLSIVLIQSVVASGIIYHLMKSRN